jgi:uncharacterized protein
MPEYSNRVHLTWQCVEEKVYELADEIKNSCYHPNIVAGIARGGVVPARIFCKALKVRPLYCVNVKKPSKSRGGLPRVITEIKATLYGKKVLVVEDALETGKSLAAVKKYFKEKRGAIVKTAALFVMHKSEEEPDYYLHDVSEIPKFPWE